MIELLEKNVDFKIWNGKRMIYPPNEYNIELVWNRVGGWTVWDTSSRDIKTHEQIAGQFSKNHFKMLQYVGLKDIEGNKLYEGDIIEGTTYRYGLELKRTNSNQVNYKGYIEYNEERAMYMVGDDLETQGYLELKDCVHRNDCFRITGKKIGNLFENPGLLKGD